MRVLDTDGDGRISLAEMRDAVIAIYRERKNLAFTLKACTHLSLVAPAGDSVRFIASGAAALRVLLEERCMGTGRMLSCTMQCTAQHRKCVLDGCLTRWLMTCSLAAGHAHSGGQGGAYLCMRAAHHLRLLLPIHF